MWGGLTCPTGVYPNETHKKSPNRVGFCILERSFLQTHPIGNIDSSYTYVHMEENMETVGKKYNYVD